ncbi:glycoside hydrolase family 28 protein [Cellvibrio polysaccharolyticus]|uniref:Glycoside hydrolase family 28 protein n=1 Tax=Cellvibrio polysaccharolyticus TaxID=2082724 RepID=A0A928V4P2_9GAMM|nr:glycoside hydrolase family 28 protein [Cellvibrio polysaccharolyticus]MBE8718207.1 glycoside hydrolase family 28 protein [Cellvibrio polysaccharolyticus]
MSSYQPRPIITLVSGISLLFSASCFAAAADNSKPDHSPATVQAEWKKADEIVKSIKAPVIKGADYNITKFGAVGDGKKDARPAIMEAIKKANSEGGGRVVIPEGTWLSNGPIHLQSHVNLHISEGATLLFGTQAKDYLPVVFTRWEGVEMYGYSPLIYAHKVTDIAITGSGTIDGNTKHEFHTWARNDIEDIAAIRKLGFDGVPLKDRQFGEGRKLRPSMLQIIDAERVLLEDYTIKNSPFWINHLVYTNDAVMRNVKLESFFANNDGIDIDSSRNVLIENNHFNTADDAIVVKSGRDLDGRTVARPSENIVIRNNVMGGEDGIALGSEMSGDIRHVYFTDNTYTKGSAAIRFKSNLDRGGVVEHIRVRNMNIEAVDKLFWFELTYAAGSMGGNFPPTYRDIVFENITVGHTKSVFHARVSDQSPLKHITLRNVEIKKADALFDIENVQDLVFDNVRINGKTVTSPTSSK